MSLSVHLNFNGQCREAFQFYEEVLDGQIGTMLSFNKSPMKNSVPEHWQDKIIHANIHIKNMEIAGGDLLPDQYFPPVGFNLLLTLETEIETKNIFEKLSVNGSIVLPLQKTFWSSSYGIVVDQFSIPWKLSSKN